MKAILATLGKGTFGLSGSAFAFVFMDVGLDTPLHIVGFIISAVIAVLTIWNLSLDNIKKRQDRKDWKRDHPKNRA